MTSDIQTTGLIARFPARYRPYAVLARLDRPVGIWLLLIPALWSIALATYVNRSFGAYTVFLYVLFFAGAVVMRAAGCVINDLWDRKFDAQVERTKCRPLASGEISVENALIFLAMLLMGGLIVLLLLSPTTIMLGLLVIPLIVLYPLTKRFTYWPQAILGLTFNFGALMGWAAVADTLTLSALLLYLAGVFWTLGYDTVYAHQDKEDDMLIGVKSTALLFAGESKIFVAGFYGTALFCLFLSMLFSGVTVYAYAGLLLAGAHLGWQILRWDSQNAESSLNVFRSNRDFGLVVFLALLLSYIS